MPNAFLCKDTRATQVLELVHPNICGPMDVKARSVPLKFLLQINYTRSVDASTYLISSGNCVRKRGYANNFLFLELRNAMVLQKERIGCS